MVSRLLAGSGPSNDEYTNITDDRASVFGGIIGVDFEKIVISFVVVLMIIISIEFSFDKLHEAANESGQIKLFNKMQREIVLLGMISFGVFIVESSIKLDRHGSWFFSFEIVHILIVFMGFSFLFQALFLMSYSRSFMTQQLKALRMTSIELLRTYEKIEENKPKRKSWFEELQSAYNLSNTNSHSEYKIIRELFVQINPELPAETFNFSAYIGILFQSYIADLGEVSPYTWLFLACIVCINGFKNGVVDPVTHDLAYFEGNHISILRYGIVGGFILTVAVITLFVFSYHYYYCMIKKGIEVVDCFASAKTAGGKLDEVTYKACLSPLMDKEHEVQMAEKLEHKSKTSSAANKMPTSPSRKLIKGSETASRKTLDLSAFKKEREEKEFRKLHSSLRSKHLPLQVRLFNYYRAFVNFFKHFGKKLARHEDGSTVLHKIFFLESPELYFYMIEVALLLQCFYTAICVTQLIPIASKLKDSGRQCGWVIGLLTPIFLNLVLIRFTLTKAVILRSIYELHHEAFSLLIEQELSEISIRDDLKEKLMESIGETRANELSLEERKYLIQETFNEFDYDGSGEITKDEFRELLGNIHMYLSQKGLDVLWNDLDDDLSGAVTFDEFFTFIFPMSKEELKEELGSVQKLREKYRQRMLSQGIPQKDWERELKNVFKKFDVDHSGYIEDSEFESLVCWVDKELGLSKDVKTMYSALNIADHRKGISWEEIVKLFDTSTFKSRWLEDINRIKRYMKDEFEGQDLDTTEAQIEALKEIHDATINNIHCRRRRGIKHFKHMLYLQEIEINPKVVNKFFEAINLTDKDSFDWDEIFAFFFAVDDVPKTKQVLLQIKNSILSAHPQPNTLKEMEKNFQKFDQDNSKNLDRYEFKALLKEWKLELDGASERFLLASKSLWDADGMISFEKLTKILLLEASEEITEFSDNKV